MNIEILMNDFRVMAQSLKVLRVELEWIDPETGDPAFSYEKDVTLGVFNVKNFRNKHDRLFPQLTRAELWKLDLLVDFELCQYIGLARHSGDFKAQLNAQVANARSDVATLTRWVEEHRDVNWAWEEKEKEEE